MAGRWGRVGLVGALAVVVVACGGGGDDDDDRGDGPTTTTAAPTTTTAPDPYAGATAESLLLTPADVGADWVVQTQQPTLCGGEPLAENPTTFGDPPDAAETALGNEALGASESVALHRDADAAQAALDAWKAKMETCDRRGTQDGIEFVIGMSTDEAVGGAYGDDSWVAKLTIEAAGQTFAGYETVFRHGRALVHFNVVGRPESLPDQTAVELMTLAQQKSMPATG